MSLSAQQRREGIEVTAQAAADFVADMTGLREILASGRYGDEELRQASHALKRWISEAELSSIAGPRVTKLRLSLPDYAAFYRADEKLRLDFFGLLGGRITALAPNTSSPQELMALMPPPNAPLRTAQARLDTFRTQQVLCLRGQWVSRASVINYVANFTSDHPEHDPKEYEGDIIALLPHTLRYVRQDDGDYSVKLGFDFGQTEEAEPHPAQVDVLVSEIWSTMTLLTESKDVQKLESVIKAEA